MNFSDAAQLREKWGDKPCDHREIEAEVEAGHPSDKYICTTCGKAGVGNKWNTPIERTDSKLTPPRVVVKFENGGWDWVVSARVGLFQTRVSR